MFGIRRIYDAILPRNRLSVAEVQQICADQFSGLDPSEIEQLPDKLRNPFKQRFRTILYVAENSRKHVQGFAMLMHDPELNFCYLEYIASAKQIKGRGIGAALYERVRDETLRLGAFGLFFECLPDEPDRCSDPGVRKQNAARLKFYERYGARPIVGTSYELPLKPDESDNMPHLVYDDLDRNKPLRRSDLRDVVRAVLERKYAELCSPEYVKTVLDSIVQDPVRLREFRYIVGPAEHKLAEVPAHDVIPVAVNDKHDIHHVRDRGYVESPVRIKVIQSELEASGLIEVVPVRHYPTRHIKAVHDADFVDYLQRACASTPENKSVYPYVFPIRNATRPPKELSVRAGYYCIDTFTPINRNAFLAARRAVDCAMTAADEIQKGRRIAYALIRPPGHHAESRVFGGFCYFNNNAVAAHYLSQYGKVAILDVDYHHGNGQQEIFYERDDVLTVSIHGNPDFAYPYFTGFADETGAGAGEGFNVNIALPEVRDGAQYREALGRAIKIIADFAPVFLVVALGLDPAKGDPTGTWMLTAKDFQQNGQRIGELGLPTLVIQEGGYRTRTLGVNARHFFQGLVDGAYRL